LIDSFIQFNQDSIDLKLGMVVIIALIKV
jgi:hypothetical protein